MKKLMVLTGVILLTFALAACSGGSGDTPTSAPDNVSSSAEVVASVPEATIEEIIAEEEIIADEPEEEDESIYDYSVAVDDIIEFGGYEWQVLDLKGGKALIISECIVEQREYHSAAKRITWEGCTLRQYLNEDFYHSFTEEEQAHIAKKQVTTEMNPWFGTPGGNTTDDMIFLLSLQEVVKYFGDSGLLKDRPGDVSFLDDEYNAARKAYDKNGNALLWWLRTAGQYAFDATEVFSSGIIDPSGINVITDEEGGVRPVLWLNL